MTTGRTTAAGSALDRVGLLLCVLSAAAFGSLAIFGKQAYAGGLGVVGVLALRFGLAAPLLVGLALVARRSLRLGWPVALRLLALGGIGYAIQATLFFNALSRIPAGMAALLLYLYPALVTAGAVALGRSRLDRATAAGLALSLAGIVLVIGLPGERLDAVGVGLALASACWYTCYILVGEYLLRGVDPLAASAYVELGGGLLVPGRRGRGRGAGPPGGGAVGLCRRGGHGRGRHRPGHRRLPGRHGPGRVGLGVDRLVVRAGVHRRPRRGRAR